MPHAYKSGMRYMFDQWGRPFTLQNPRDLSDILTYTKKLSRFGAKDSIIWAP
jgi:hypothetical protein